MTESEWENATHPTPMLHVLQEHGRVSERKLRLFAAACCRPSWSLLSDERSQRAIEVAEQYADGTAGDEELDQAAAAAQDVSVNTGPLSFFYLYSAVDDVVQRKLSGDRTFDAAIASCTANNAADALLPDKAARVRECHRQADLLRDIFGNPLRPPPTVEAAWLSGTVVALAQAAYDERQMPSGHLDRGRLTVLADALEESGCDSEEILAHLRGPGPCVRGCHVIDLLLNKA